VVIPLKKMKKLIIGIAMISALVAGVTFGSGAQASQSAQSSQVQVNSDPGDLG
jgi:hypothetical protein